MINDKELFQKELDNMLSDPKVQRMKEFPQHHGSNTLRHCAAVAIRSFELAEKLRWKINVEELVHSAILHDYYLYDIKEQGLSPYAHGASHPAAAIRNAKKDFALTDREMSMIRSHMWPLTLMHPPRSKEAVLLCLADKDVALKEVAAPEVKRAKRLAGKIRNITKRKNG